MCHLSVILTFLFGGRRRKMATLIVKLLVSIPLSRKHLSVFWNLTCLEHWNIKKQFLLWFLEMIYWPSCQLAFGKAWYSRCWFVWKKLWWETFEHSCRLSDSLYCLWSTGISIFDRINGSYAHGLLFGGYRVWQISTRICVSRNRCQHSRIPKQILTECMSWAPLST